MFGGTVHVAEEIYGIMGIVTQGFYANHENQKIHMALGVVIHASFIRELIDSIPDQVSVQLPGGRVIQYAVPPNIGPSAKPAP